MSCELKPGERLVIDDLARRLHVSPIPVREAIQMLQSEGLVVVIPHIGATVAQVTPESVQDVFAVLEGLEIVAARLVTQRARPEELAALAAAVDEMDRVVARGDDATYAKLNTRFHLMIGTMPGLPMLAEMTERAFVRWDRIRRFFFRGVLQHRLKKAQVEHREIINAMTAGNLARVDAAVRFHNREALMSYTNFLKRQGTQVGGSTERSGTSPVKQRRDGIS
jgi:DNA-binding GntR family transcriptional regulator